MKQIEIKNRFSDKIILAGKYESIKECLEKNRGADLRGAKSYLNSHNFFQEIVRRQKVDTFTQKEWSMIGQMIVHTLCWNTIKKRFGKSAMGIFKKLSKVGFKEWMDKYKEL